MRLNFYVTAGLKIDVCFSVSHTPLTVTLNGDEVKMELKVKIFTRI